MFWPSASSPVSVEAPSASTSPLVDDLAALDRIGRWLSVVELVGTRELLQVVDVHTALRRRRFHRRSHAPQRGWRRHSRRRRRGEPARRPWSPRQPYVQCRYPQPAFPDGAEARPDAACSNPSERGWRRRVQGTESGLRQTDTICAGATSMYCTRSGEAMMNSPFSRALTQFADQTCRYRPFQRWPGRSRSLPSSMAER